jgi:BlaI family penicillinase repressor
MEPVSFAPEVVIGENQAYLAIQLYIDTDIRMYKDADMKTKKTQISAAESQVMEALWRGGPLTPEEIIAATAKANDWGTGTVRTLIARLLRKGFIAGARQEDGYVYKPLISRADYVGSETQLLLDRLFGGEVAPLVAHFVSAQKLTTADIRKLKKLIREMEK